MENGADNYRLFLNGDDEGLVRLIRQYKDGLILYMCSFVSDFTTAEELCEDTFVRLGVKRPHFNGKSSFKTWLYAIGRNVALDYLRRKRRQSEISAELCPEEADMELLEENYLQKEQKIALHRAMMQLKAEYRQVLWLIYFDGFSCKEAAQIMSKSTHAVETLSYRAKISLKCILEKEGFTYEVL